MLTAYCRRWRTARRVALTLASAAVVLSSPSAASAQSCSSQHRVDRLLTFFEGWRTGTLDLMTLDRPASSPPPFATALPRRKKAWPARLRHPRTLATASVRAWLRRRARAGDRLTLLRVNILHNGGTTGGVLSFRRAAPDIRHKHKIYGAAKFEVRCGGLTALANSRSWWRWTPAISVCHPGRLIRGVRFCGRIP
jgi:hypothetical protein